MSDPNVLLAWMAARGPGEVAARSISDAGPRAFRRRAEADVALSGLIKAGRIVTVSARPRAFRVVRPPVDRGTPKPADDGPVPLAEIGVMLGETLARYRDGGLPPVAIHYLAARDVHERLRADARINPLRFDLIFCQVCGAPRDDEGPFLRFRNGALVHGRCFGIYRDDRAARIDALIVATISGTEL